MEKIKLTVIIPTFNVEDIIEASIRSVLWADEILVVDSFSNDKTCEIAESLGAKVLKHEYVYSAKQKNWAIPQAKNNWILLLDSDEVVTLELRKTIEKLFENNTIGKFEGYGIARKHFFFGKFLRWGGRYPLYNIRLFNKSCRYEDRNVHAHIILEKEKMRKLKGDILHYSDRNILQFMEKFNRYAKYQADYMVKISQRGINIEWKKFFTNPFYSKSIIKDIWFFLPGTSVFRFLYMYFFRFGFLDGKHGLIIALFYSMQDYCAKTRYMEIRKINHGVMRIRFQNSLIRALCYRIA